MFECDEEGSATGEGSAPGDDGSESGGESGDESVDESGEVASTGSVDSNGQEALADFVKDDRLRPGIMVIMEAWAVYLLKCDRRCAIILILLDLSGNRSSFRACLAARKDHGALLWDGNVDYPVAAIEHFNITVQPCILNEILGSFHISTLGAIHASLREPMAELMERQRNLGHVEWSDEEIKAVRKQGVLDGEVYELLRRNGWTNDDDAAWEAAREEEGNADGGR